jgi:hypothetical protein
MNICRKNSDFLSEIAFRLRVGITCSLDLYILPFISSALPILYDASVDGNRYEESA